MIKDFESTVESFNPILSPLLRPLVVRVEEKFLVGLTIINWNSLNIEDFIKDVYVVLNELKLIWKRVWF